jgi:hypothetical protein
VDVKSVVLIFAEKLLIQAHLMIKPFTHIENVAYRISEDVMLLMVLKLWHGRLHFLIQVAFLDEADK